jgi:hypothetical protein
MQLVCMLGRWKGGVESGRIKAMQVVRKVWEGGGVEG